MSNTQLVEDPREVLTVAVQELALEPSAKANVLDAYVPFFSKARALVARANDLIANPTDATADAKTARVLRIAIKEERVGAEKTRKKLKEDVLLYGKAIDGVNACVELLTKPMETKLQAIEDAEAIAEQKKRDELRAKRVDLLAPFCNSTEHYALDTMPEDAFNNLLNGMKAARDIQIAAEKRAEEQRLEALRLAEEKRVAEELAAAEEKRRLEAENARLQAEKAEAERLAVLERKKAAEVLRLAEEAAQKERDRLAAVQAEKDRLAKVEADRLAEIARVEREEAEKARKAELARIAAEQAKKDRLAQLEREKMEIARLAAEQKATEQKAEADRLARIEREKREVLEKAERDRLAAEEKKRLEALEAERRAAAAPDREKLLAFAANLRALSIPELTTDHGPAHRTALLEDLELLAKRAEFIGNYI